MSDDDLHTETVSDAQSQQSEHSPQSQRSKDTGTDTEERVREDDLNAEKEGRQLKARSSDELDDRPLRWLAPGWLASGAVAVLVGEEGIGKSLWWVRLVAHVTTGLADPTMNLPAGPPRAVVLVLTEDLWAEVKARLILAGADLSFVRVLCDASDGSGNPVLPGPDAYVVRDAARDFDAALIVVDAWLDTVNPRLRVADTQQAREALTPWANIAEITDACVLLIAHSNRLGTTSTRNKIGSTVALRQKARVLLYAATTDDEVGECVYIGPDKANSSRVLPALRYRLDVVQVRESDPHDPGTTARLTSPAGAVLTVSQLMKKWAQEEIEATRPPSAVERVAALIIDVLRAEADVRTDESGSSFIVETSMLKKHVINAKLNPDNLTAAVASLGGMPSRPDGFGRPWVFEIPVSVFAPQSQRQHS
jgi:hypothetical protein